MGIPELAAAGLCQQREALMIAIECAGVGKTLIRHPYQRSGGGKNGRGGVIVWGEREEATDKMGAQMTGRFFDWGVYTG